MYGTNCTPSMATPRAHPCRRSHTCATRARPRTGRHGPGRPRRAIRWWAHPAATRPTRRQAPARMLAAARLRPLVGPLLQRWGSNLRPSGRRCGGAAWSHLRLRYLRRRQSRARGLPRAAHGRRRGAAQRSRDRACTCRRAWSLPRVLLLQRTARSTRQSGSSPRGSWSGQPSKSRLIREPLQTTSSSTRCSAQAAAKS